jgi:hypothetical protein
MMFSRFVCFTKLKCLGTIRINQSLHEEITSRLNSANAHCYSIQSLLSFHFLFKNVKISIHRPIILPDVIHGCQTWFLTWREEHRCRLFRHGLLTRIFGPKKEEVTGDCIISSLIICAPYQILFESLNGWGRGGWGMQHGWGRREM